MNIPNAKLSLHQVQQIRALGAAGFTARSIAPNFDLCTREVTNILKGRAWWFLPVEPVELPLFNTQAAQSLKLRAPKKLTAEQKHRLETYKKNLGMHFDLEAEREAHAIALSSNWRIKSPKLRRTIAKTVKVAA
jgi:hypothetical protein